MRISVQACLVAALLILVAAFLIYPVMVNNPPVPRPQDTLLANLHQLWVSSNIYELDEGALPPMASSDALKRAFWPNYIKDETVFLNPKTGQPVLPNPALTGKKSTQLWAKTEEIVLFYAATGRSEKPIAFVRMDGTSKVVDPATWRQMKQVSRIP